MKEAIILAGGFGTRLRSVIQDIPKPMSPIGGKPFLEFLLEQLSLFSFSRTVLSVGYKHEIISNHFGHSFGAMQLDYCVEDTPLGTGGAIAKALQQTDTENVLVVNGDSILLASLEQFHDFHCNPELSIPANPVNLSRPPTHCGHELSIPANPVNLSRPPTHCSHELSVPVNPVNLSRPPTHCNHELSVPVNLGNLSRPPISIALKAERNFDRYGSVTLDGDRIVRFEEKKHVAEGVFNAGLYLINKSVKSYLSGLPAPFSFEKEIFEKQVFPISGCVFHDYFIDIGIPEDYARAQTELLPVFQQYANQYAKP